MSNLVNLTCFHCNGQYSLSNHIYRKKIKKGTKRFFCSKSCLQLNRSLSKESYSCFECNKNFYRTKSQAIKSKHLFCSSSCAAKHNNKGIQRNPKKLRKCNTCFAEYTYEKTRRSKLCLDCFNTRSTKNITLKDCISNLSVQGKPTSWKTVYVRQHNANYNRNLKKLPCQKCGYDKHVELSHIKPVISFPDDAKLTEINAPENILVLCPNCHWEFDNKLINLDQIPTRNNLNLKVS